MISRAAPEEFLATIRERIDASLDAILPAETVNPAGLHRAMRYAVFSGGKRLRPALTFGAAVAAGADPERADPVAIAVELVHTCSLVLDDLPDQDNNPVRRGQPSVHVAAGQSTAVLAASALLTEAFAQCARLSDVSTSVAVSKSLARAIGSQGLIGGQIDDLAFDCCNPSPQQVLRIHLRKTAALFRFATWSGGVAGGLEGALAERLDAFGRRFGLAFQVVDDLLDEKPDECSILHVLSRTAARRRARKLLGQAICELEEFGSSGWALAGLARGLQQRIP